MSLSVAERVANGIRVLNEKISDWLDCIDLNLFNYDRRENCVLGQIGTGYCLKHDIPMYRLDSGYFKALELLGVLTFDERGIASSEGMGEFEINHGFHGGPYYGAVNEEWFIQLSTLKNQKEIEVKAYLLWEAAGRPHGDNGNHFWNLAQLYVVPRAWLIQSGEAKLQTEGRLNLEAAINLAVIHAVTNGLALAPQLVATHGDDSVTLDTFAALKEAGMVK